MGLAENFPKNFFKGQDTKFTKDTIVLNVNIFAESPNTVALTDVTVAVNIGAATEVLVTMSPTETPAKEKLANESINCDATTDVFTPLASILE